MLSCTVCTISLSVAVFAVSCYFPLMYSSRSSNWSTMNFSAQGIPIIDFSSAFDGTDQTDLIAAVTFAMDKFHCFFAKNNGITPSLLHDTQSDMRTFFKLPLDYKKQFEETRHTRGYIPFETINVAEYNGVKGYPNDPLERYMVGPKNKNESYEYAENIWPDQPATFKGNMEDIFEGFERLGTTVTSILAKAADVPREQFDKVCQKGLKYMKVNYFPGGIVPKEKQDTRLGAHVDATVITMLMNVEKGLQVMADDGQWMDADPVPDAILVQAGEKLDSIVPNRGWKGNTHKVAWPAGQAQERISIAFFFPILRSVEREQNSLPSKPA